jgi:TetR/AcrR family transcriptional repressor of nem operon
MSKAERTKQFIIEQVAPVFNKKGYAATSLKDLTDTTGLSKGAIYGNFKNKNEVALRAFEHNFAFIGDRLRENILAAQTCREKLFSYPKTFREISQLIIQSGGCPILNTAVDSGEVNEQLLAAVRKTIGLWKQTLMSFIETGISLGEFSENTDAEKTAQILICLVEGGFAMFKATGEDGYMKNSLSQVEFIIKML